MSEAELSLAELLLLASVAIASDGGEVDSVLVSTSVLAFTSVLESESAGSAESGMAPLLEAVGDVPSGVSLKNGGGGGGLKHRLQPAINLDVDSGPDSDHQAPDC